MQRRVQGWIRRERQGGEKKSDMVENEVKYCM